MNLPPFSFLQYFESFYSPLKSSTTIIKPAFAPMASLAASYTSTNTSSTEPTTFAHSLPAIASEPTTEDRVQYLSSLGNAVKNLQNDVNAFLTQKMEEDKAMGLKGGDEELEQNYGEEDSEGE